MPILIDTTHSPRKQKEGFPGKHEEGNHSEHMDATIKLVVTQFVLFAWVSRPSTGTSPCWSRGPQLAGSCGRRLPPEQQWLR